MKYSVASKTNKDNINEKMASPELEEGNQDDDVSRLVDDEEESISSEESGGCDNDCNDRVRRSRNLQEIWDEEEIWNSLLNLPSCYILRDILKGDNLDLLDSQKDAKITGLLLSVWTGNELAVKHILEQKANVNYLDSYGRSPLHLAATAGHESIIKTLLENGAKINQWDGTRQLTPLHCAASRGHLGCVKLLLNNGADINAGIGNKTPLHYATQCNSVECVRELLHCGANPNTTQVFSETPLHIASALGSVEIIKLLLQHKAEVRVQNGEEKTTALHLAAEDGNAESAKLLLDFGATISATNKKLQTPLHFASLSQSSETLELLLKRGANPNAQDIDGRTPLHSAIVKVARSCECMRLLIKYGADVNISDNFGYTPLHLAALNEFPQCVLLLLSHGGDVTARTNGGISVLTFITRRTPEVIPKIIEKFDNSIKVNDHEIGDVDCELKLDFRILVPSTTKGETELLLNFIEVGHRELLNHPLCETFLFLKWRRIRKYFFVSLVYHFIFAALFTSYIIGVFLRDCPSRKRTFSIPPQIHNHTPAEAEIEKLQPHANPELSECLVKAHVRIIGYLITCFNIALLMKELFQVAHSWRTYVKQWENWLQWMIIVSVFCCVVVENKNIQYNLYAWHHHVAAIGIFFTWLELMMIVGRFPMFGLYVQMFTTVSINFTKFLMAYLCLLIAFALSFSVLLPNYPAFADITASQLKIIMMMTGELEFEDIFYNNDTDINYPYTTHIMFATFVILVTVILMNLMVGLAVSDIQGLQQSAGLDRLVRQAELVAHLESMLFSRLLHWVPLKLMNFLHKHALLLKSEYHWALYIKPNDPRETRIPNDLIKNIYKLVAQQKPSRKRRSEYKTCSNNKRYIFHKYNQSSLNGKELNHAVPSSPIRKFATSLDDSRMNSLESNHSSSMDDINVENAFRMRLTSLNKNRKNNSYKNILLK